MAWWKRHTSCPKFFHASTELPAPNSPSCPPKRPKYYLRVSRSRVLSVKLTGSQLLNDFPEFYKTWSFITSFTRARHMSLSWARLIQSTTHPTSRNTFKYYPFMYAWIFQVTFPDVSLPKPCLQLSSFLCVLHALLLSVFFIWSSK
jgi:hypothetical protein